MSDRWCVALRPHGARRPQNSMVAGVSSSCARHTVHHVSHGCSSHYGRLAYAYTVARHSVVWTCRSGWGRLSLSGCRARASGRPVWESWGAIWPPLNAMEGEPDPNIPTDLPHPNRFALKAHRGEPEPQMVSRGNRRAGLLQGEVLAR
jgi:hypothetical protein